MTQLKTTVMENLTEKCNEINRRRIQNLNRGHNLPEYQKNHQKYPGMRAWQMFLHFWI